ncbi:MAG: ABC transporter permease [Bacillati bacterium ANGP1]|uniref:ABC transporter permease n=1 Tax=Candidatus Segetimicrobium genomatis TaxID=2569760 RepID=A0A537JAT2_9BACT|nr:MAG: ABC transporter permease [Terrabacteria group bacterium ANGP1]
MLSSTPESATPSLATHPVMRRSERSAWRMAVKRFWRNGNARTGFTLIVLFTLIAIFAPRIAPEGYDDENLAGRLRPPTAQHWFGTDELGRDVFSRVIYGARISMTVGFLAVTGALASGSLLGIAAGYLGGRVDGAIMRTMDVMLAFPSVILAIGIVAMRGPGLNNTILAVSIVNIPVYARVARASTLAIKEHEYVTAARAMGARAWRILMRVILPNGASPLVVQGTLGVAGAILDAAALGFLGLGAQPPAPEWAVMLSDSYKYLLTAFWAALAPGAAIAAVVLSFNLAGDGLHDALDPRLSGSF